MHLRTRLTQVAAAAIALAAAPSPAPAQGFSTTNVQLLQGFSFDDRKTGADTRSGDMTTVTVNHFSTWEYGDNFFFVDLQTGYFNANGNGNAGSGFRGEAGATLYGEWHPRLFVNKLAGQKAPLLGLFGNYGLAFELNQGQGFYAYLAGVGVDFALPQPYSAGLNVYYRYDRFDRHAWQVSPFWNIPFALGPVPLLFSGFVDVAGSTDIDRNRDLDVMAQPELLVDVLAPFGGKANRLYVGVEWYWHRYPSGFYGSPAPGHTTSAPQAMLQWTVY
jgi:nucleoside-specific outer membrane channel protein Tsx